MLLLMDMYTTILGSVRVHNCETSELVCQNKFTGGGTSLIWATNAVSIPILHYNGNNSTYRLTQLVKR